MSLANLERLLRPIRARLAGVLVRGVWRLVYPGGGMRLGQVSLLKGQSADRVEAPENYGFASEPLPGAEAFAGRIGASPDHTVVLVVADRRYRLQGLATGEVAIYDDLGSQIVLRRGGAIEIVASGGVSIQGDLQVSGDVSVDGSLATTGDVGDAVGTLAGLRQKYNVHTHGETGGTTSPPTPTDP